MARAERKVRTLPEYRAKRDFTRTPEPTSGKAGRSAGKRKGATAAGTSARFVVHEHHARRLHWDLRLERDGALLSWAVPNGIPLDPSENRKAIHVEDHPLEYLDFEGEIPAGSYGAGSVAIWDSGRYECEKLREDEVIVVLHGQRLQGRYALFRAGAQERDWMIHRMDPPARPREAMPEHLAPMLAHSGRLPHDDARWAYEVKWDGVRALLYWRPGRLRIESRNRNEITMRYPELRALGRQLGMREAVLDGEIVACDERGRPSFERLQQRMHLTSDSAIRRAAQRTPATYMIFDLLYLDGRLTTELPYRRRRELLEQLQLQGPAWQVPAARHGGGQELLEATAAQGLEGVLAKRLDSPYRPGQRSGEWLKVKHVARQELVIGGWLPGKDGRAGRVGALLVGYYEHGDGRPALRYAGRVGAGFDESELHRLGRELMARATRSSPFAARGVQPPREARFVAPQLVAEVEFSRWTRDRILRHSVYRGLREDKPAEEVVLEAVWAPGSVEDGAAGDVAQGRRASAPRAAGKSSVVSPTRSARGAPRRAAARGAERAYEVVRATKRHTEIEVDGRTLRLSNRDKVLYPATGFTKDELIDYYAAVAPYLLPHLTGRPLTLKRYPDGVEEQYFFEKRCPAHRPEWVRTAPVWSEREQEEIEYCLCEDLPTLIWVANLAAIELHPSLSRARDMDAPTAAVFDLDPGEGAGLRECARVALSVREIFDVWALRTFVKTSGSKGLQVYVPLGAGASYAQTKPFARAVAELLEKQHPALVVSRMARRLRAGRVLIDWSQNDPHKTTVAVYSLRAQAEPLASTPLRWEEVERASRWRRERRLSLAPAELLRRVERDGDPFAEALGLEQRLPDLAPATGRAPTASPSGGPS